MKNFGENYSQGWLSNTDKYPMSIRKIVREHLDYSHKESGELEMLREEIRNLGDMISGLLNIFSEKGQLSAEEVNEIIFNYIGKNPKPEFVNVDKAGEFLVDRSNIDFRPVGQVESGEIKTKLQQSH